MSAAGDVWGINVLRAGTKWSVPFFNKLLVIMMGAALQAQSAKVDPLRRMMGVVPPWSV